MNNDRIHKQIRSLLTRWGYKPIEAPPGQLALYCRPGVDANLWIYPTEDDMDDDEYQEVVVDIAKIHGFDPSDIRRLIEAEPVDRDLGTIELHPQPLTEWGDREDHAEAAIVMDARGRDRLIAALIEGRDSIVVYGESGGGYCLNLKTTNKEDCNE